MTSPQKISLVIPSFNEEGNINNLYIRLQQVLRPLPYDFEIIFVDDGSTDNTLARITELAASTAQVKYLSFSKNFGHQKALKAGLDHARGDCVISLDADLQHPPELIPQLLQKWQEGYEIVFTIRKDNQEVGWFKKTSASFFYFLLNKLSGLNIVPGTADYRLIDQKVVKVIRRMKEDNLFIRGMIPWFGFKQFGIEYTPDARTWGKSKYTLKKMVLFALQGITSFSVKPLHLTTLLGAFIFFLSMTYIVYALTIYFFTHDSIPGWASILISVLFLGGLNLMMLGILGEYIGKLVVESKRRPNYIISQKNL